MVRLNPHKWRRSPLLPASEDSGGSRGLQPPERTQIMQGLQARNFAFFEDLKEIKFRYLPAAEKGILRS
jgi:hypothetical protein